ncbi:MAG TPA: hypothetical protein VJT49_15300 [Amycolatopsis sp.]|uniref:hypothetical protein n=1 Tax=Amycolatopsis sp. TaxID=37632 RepID=UPI002B45A2B3|nr:hypothetical protein [Amycolatopsis sp.]HKS46445.1 hypothetical protein [Amycolatopsis sp.]
MEHISAHVVPPIDRTLRETEIITAAGIFISSLEYLCQSRHLEESGLLSWQVGRTKYRWASRKGADLIDPLVTTPGINIVLGLRLAAATAVLAPGAARELKALAMGYLALTNLVLHLRNSHGSDGSDHMNVIVCTALAASKLFGDDERAKKVCTAFIAAQSCLSYVAAGAAKLISPFWRDGTAMAGIFRTRTYGQKHISKLFNKHPLLARTGGWAVVIGELLFPVTLVAPKRLAQALLATGFSFHLGNAALMGLNRFLWSFGATYPSVAFHSRSLASRKSAA